MHSSDSEDSADDSGAGDDPRQSSFTSKSLAEIEDLYSSGSDESVPATPVKQFEEADGQSDSSSFHTPAQPSKRRRLPTPPVRRQKDVVHDSDSDGFERDDLFDPRKSKNRGFTGIKRPRLPWSLVKTWSLDEHGKETVYEEIRAIMEQSLANAGSKSFIKGTHNSIAGWRQKQVSGTVVFAF